MHPAVSIPWQLSGGQGTCLLEPLAWDVEPMNQTNKWRYYAVPENWLRTNYMGWPTSASLNIKAVHGYGS